MHLKLSALWILLWGAAACLGGEEWHKPAMKTAIDFGHVVKGIQSGKEIRMLPMNRNTVTMDWERSLAQNWQLRAGLKGIIWWPFGGDGNMPHERIMRVEPGLSMARLRGSLGQTGYLEMGFFPYKYNPDALNLGEYLHRSGTYPGYLITTDNWQFMTGAVNRSYGFHAHFAQWGGTLTHDITLFTETDISPIGDFSPGYEIGVKLGLLELGAGAVFSHLISFHPSDLKPKLDENTYIQTNAFTNTSGTTVPAFSGPLKSAPGEVTDALADSSQTAKVSHWSLRGIKLMGRAAFHLGGLFPEGVLGPNDLRLFLELAVLGVQDQPYYYENIKERIPVMAGLTLPVFGLIDVLSLQAEHYSSPYDDFHNLNTLALPIWREGETAATRDDWKWSVNLEKTLNPLFKLHLQVANDHLRTLKFDMIKSDIPLMRNPSHWYYLAKLEFGL